MAGPAATAAAAPTAATASAAAFAAALALVPGGMALVIGSMRQRNTSQRVQGMLNEGLEMMYEYVYLASMPASYYKHEDSHGSIAMDVYLDGDGEGSLA